MPNRQLYIAVLQNLYKELTNDASSSCNEIEHIIVDERACMHGRLMLIEMEDSDTAIDLCQRQSVTQTSYDA